MTIFPIRKIYKAEAWKPVLNAVGYEVSNYGRVRSFRKVGSKGKIFDTPQTLLKPVLDSDGYYIVTIWTDLKAKTRKVHQLVLEAFVGPCPKGMVCCHNDSCRTNNKLNNLRWGTPDDNHQDRVKHGNSPVGERNCKSKLTNQQIIQIRTMSDTHSNLELAKIFGVSHGQMCKITSGKSWRHI